MTTLYQIYCKYCGKNTGLAVSEKNVLKEMTYNCLHCRKGGKAKKAKIEEIKKEDWEKDFKDWN